MPPRRPPVPRTANPSSRRLDLRPDPAEALDHGRDPVRLLVAQLPRAGDHRPPLGKAARERDQRQLVDRQRHLVAGERAWRPAGHGERRSPPGARVRPPSGPPRPPRKRPSDAATPSRPTRVGLRPTPSSRTRLRARAPPRRGGRRPTRSRRAPRPAPGPAAPRADGDPPDRAAVHRRQGPQLRDLDLGAGRGQQALGVVASRSGLDHPGLPLGEQAGDQHARLDLGAGHRKLVGDAVERRAVDAKRRQAAVAALHRGPHHPQRLGNPVDGTAPDRLVSVEVQAPAPCPASQPGRMRSKVPAFPPRSSTGPRRRRSAPPGRAARSRAPADRCRRPRRPDGPRRPARPAPGPRPGWLACPPRRDSPRPPSPPPPSPRSAPPGG